jgi:hypothetical protein
LETLESLKSIRKDPSPLDLLQDLPATVETLFPPSSADDDEKRHFGLVATALILIGNGFTDECHNLVTPLSWPDDIHFAHGPSVYSQVSAEARAYATYTHCLVHRREAFNVGEFGMLGFANANYWSNAVAKSPGVSQLPHHQLVSEVRKLVQAEPGASNWAEQHLQDDHFFESRAVHELCANVLKGDVELQEFAEQVAETEVRVLLGHVLQKAGFDVSVESILRSQHAGDSSNPPPQAASSESIESPTSLIQAPPSQFEIDEAIALTAGRKVSSAHQANFEASGSIVLRQTVVSRSDALSAAAGIACRLMNSPACRLLEIPPAATDREILQIALPTTNQQVDSVNKLIGADGLLSSGDLVARVISGQPSSSSQDDGCWFHFVPCDASDSSVLFADRLFGTRGETPTTVVQWSKGTIF